MANGNDVPEDLPLEKLETITKAGKIVHDPGQKEYAYNLIEQFYDLHRQFSDFHAVKRLFGIDNSDTFNVSEVVTKLGDSNGFPEALNLEFTKAGFPLPKKELDKAVTAVEPKKYRETRWKVSVVLPEDEASVITGKGIAAADRVLTLTFPSGVTPTKAQLKNIT